MVKWNEFTRQVGHIFNSIDSVVKPLNRGKVKMLFRNVLQISLIKVVPNSHLFMNEYPN